MLTAIPSSPRQLTRSGPFIVWRDRAGGGREGLVLSAQACSNPKCDCRDVALEGWLVDDTLLAVEAAGMQVRVTAKPGAPGLREAKVLSASVNVDSGVVTAGPPSTEAAAAWLRAECDDELRANLRARLEDGKSEALAPFDWRTEDWSWWREGQPVRWADLDLDDAVKTDDVEIGSDQFIFDDTYCIEPGCSCDTVEVFVQRDVGADQELGLVGTVMLRPAALDGALLLAHGPAREELKRAWTAWCAARPVAKLLTERQAAVRALVPELRAHIAATREKTKPVKAPKAGRNAPCPCGSGKKFKVCCGA